MRILLVHNPKAGSEKHEGENFIKALKKAGHKAIYQSSKQKGIKRALKKKFDLVLVAGGDGTVTRVARRLVAMKSEIPLAVLPMGTANNFARSLGFCLSTKELIEQLNDGKCDTFDVGLGRGPWGERYFFEGTGAGLFADYLRAPKRDEPKSKTEAMRASCERVAPAIADLSGAPVGNRGRWQRFVRKLFALARHEHPLRRSRPDSGRGRENE
jgi:diacylglycerol kinase (ATP)